jgi:hypothetical protein
VTVPASNVFDFLERHRTLSVERHEIFSAEFSTLRYNLRSIIFQLREGDSEEASDISGRLRSLLSEWLTTPVEFDAAILEAVQTLGTPAAIESRWGGDMRTWYEAACIAAQTVTLRENPVRERLRALLRQLRVEGADFRIYCHRMATSRFESILDEAVDAPLGASCFLHSLKDYRETAPFEVMIKVGPLRSRGWGAIPDAVVVAPRFARMIQIVWSGCSDEADFGYDPVASPQGDGTTAWRAGVAGVSWTTQVTRDPSDQPVIGEVHDEDELGLFRELDQVRERRRATLIQIDEGHGILYPAHAKILSFDPDPTVVVPLDRRLPGETLVEGMYVVRPFSIDADLGGLRAEHGRYSLIWKARLTEELGRDHEGLTERLRASGLDLVHLRSAIAHWCKPPTTVIHAPQQARHFEILIRVLGIDFEAEAAFSEQRRAWWRYAWKEIGQSRGEAIQQGVQEQEIVEEQFCASLGTILPDIRLRASEGESFKVEIPHGHGLDGTALFDRVYAIETGFLTPDSELRIVQELHAIERWRG